MLRSAKRSNRIKKNSGTLIHYLNIQSALPVLFVSGMIVLLFISDIVSMSKSGFTSASYPLASSLVNYSAGFIRRGLFGEIIHCMNGIFQPIISIALLSAMSYLFILYLLISRMIRMNTGLPCMLAIILSPSIILMHRGSEFFRTDGILIALNLAAAAMLLNFLVKGNKLSRGGGASFVGMLVIDSMILGILALSALLHELSAVLMPPVILIFFIYCRRLHRIMHFILVLDLLVILYTVMMVNFKFSSPNIVLDSWSGIYSNTEAFRLNRGLLNVVDQKTSVDTMNMSIVMFKQAPLKIILHLLIAVAVPFVVLLMSGITILHSASSRAKRIRCILIALCTCHLALSITAHDWGRWFSICAINIVAYSLLIAHPTGRKRGNTASNVIRKAEAVAKQFAILATATVLLNYSLGIDGYFRRTNKTVPEEIRQMRSNLPDFFTSLKPLLKRDIIIHP